MAHRRGGAPLRRRGRDVGGPNTNQRCARVPPTDDRHIAAGKRGGPFVLAGLPFRRLYLERPAPNRDDIWIKSVDGEAMRHLINTPDLWEKWPQWSPDGQWIAFSRRLEDQWVVVKVSPLGGPEQTIADSAGDAAWTPDGRGLVMRSFGTDDRSAIVHQEDRKSVV